MNVTPITGATTAATGTVQAANTGIVPPWLENAGARRADEGERRRNPGIVPPWLQQPGIVRPDAPVGPDTPAILGNAQATVFDPTPVEPDPDVPRILAAH